MDDDAAQAGRAGEHGAGQQVGQAQVVDGHGRGGGGDDHPVAIDDQQRQGREIGHVHVGLPVVPAQGGDQQRHLRHQGDAHHGAAARAFAAEAPGQGRAHRGQQRGDGDAGHGLVHGQSSAQHDRDHGPGQDDDQLAADLTLGVKVREGDFHEVTGS